jgi:hypothetical protein
MIEPSDEHQSQPPPELQLSETEKFLAKVEAETEAFIRTAKKK